MSTIPEPTEEQIQLANSEGRDAGDQGRPISSNPYRQFGAHPKQADAWDDGWQEGRDWH